MDPSPSEALSETATQQAATNPPSNDDQRHHGMAVGRMVEVLPRTWPGINKPGGVARVTKVYLNDGGKPTHIDVHYILARNKEKQVPLDYVQLAPQFEVESNNTRSTNSTHCQPTTSLRDRSMLLGRCKRCGSLRKDCGSCDWAYEEMEEQRIEQQQAKEQLLLKEQASPFQRRSSKSKSGKRRKRQQASGNGTPSSRWSLVSDDDELSSNSSLDDSSEEDEDDVLLRELMAQNMANYRKFRQFRVAQMLRNEAAQQATAPPPKKKTDEFSSSDSSEHEMYQSFVQYKQKLNRRSRKSDRNHHVSVLESIATSDNAQNANAITPSTGQFKTSRNGNYKTTASTSNAKQSSDEDHPSSAEKISPTIQRTNKPRRRRLVIQDESQDMSHLLEDENNDEECSDHSFGIEDDDESPVAIKEPETMDLERQHVKRLVRQAQQQESTDEGLSQFIQPEGREVAENLPDDIVDRTRNLEYHQLPDFFDDLVTQMEDEWMPDWKLKIARMLSAKRRLEYSLGPFRSRSPMRAAAPVDPLQVLQQCQDIQTQLRDELIRNGLDQCKICLHKLMDDRLYKRRKAKLSTTQRKKCRGLGIMDARNLRLDALEDTVDDLVRKIREVEKACEKHLQENAPLEDDGDETQTEMQDYSDNEQQDLENTPKKTAGIQATTDFEPSPPFHPHMHARPCKSSKETQLQRKKKRSQSNELVHRHNKRKKSVSVSRSNAGRTKNQKQRVNRVSLGVDSPVDQSEDPSEPMDAGVSFAPDSDDDEPIEETQDEDHLPHMNIFFDMEASAGGQSRRSTDDLAASESTTRTRGTSRHGRSRSSRSTRASGEDSSVPTFNLFDEDSPTAEAEGNKTYRQYQESAGRRQGDARVPISKRMEAFLLANEAGIDDFYSSTEDASCGQIPWRSSNRTSKTRRQDPEARSSSFQSEGQARRGESRSRPSQSESRKKQDSRSRPTSQESNSVPRSDDRSDKSVETENDDVVMMDLFDDLMVDCDNSLRNMDVGTGSVSVEAVCQQLQSASGQQPQRREEILAQAHVTLHRVPVIRGSETFTALNTVLSMLKENGTMTLLELVSKNSPSLRSHVHLLSLCLLSLNAVTESTDFGSCTMVKHIIENLKVFHEMVLLQLLDTLYAVLHPLAWAYKSKNSAHILRVMKPLRDSLAKVTPLTESACRCVLEKLCCQKWRRGTTNNDFAFVSSTDPSDWKEFLLNGTIPPEGEDVRVNKLGKLWPRVEIEALWSILAYLGQSPSHVDERSVSRWQLLSKLFSCGVLYELDALDGAAQMNSLPPSIEHLYACEQEIGFFTQLLSKGVLGSVPSSDTMLINLFRRSLTLEGDSFQRSTFARKKSIPTMKSGKESKRFVARLWKASDPSYFLVPDRIRSKTLPPGVLSLGSAVQGESATVRNALMPRSNMLRRCLELLYAWIKHLPHKKARQNRFTKAVNSMRAALDSVSCTTPNVVSPMKQDSFEAAFSMHQERHALGDGAQHKEAFMKEAVAWTKIIEQVALSKSDETPSNPFGGTNSLTLVAEIWDMVASDSMKERRIALIENRESMDTSTSTSPEIFVAAKVMASVAMLQMNICPWFLDTGEKVMHVWGSEATRRDAVTPEALLFSVSSVVACLDCLAGMNKSPYTSHVVSIVTLLFTNMTSFFQLSGTGRDQIGTSQLKELSSSTLLKIFNVLINGHGDDENEVCFQLLLTAIRSFATVMLDAGCVQSRGESSSADQNGDAVQGNEVDGDDIWGSIDDDLLASMDLDVGEAPDPMFSQELAKTLKNALQESKPSGRYAVPNGMGVINRLQMSSNGKHLVATELDRVCQCLVSLQIAGLVKGDSSILSDLMCVRVQSYFEDDSDSQFWVQISQFLSTELIGLSMTFASCAEIVKANFERVLFNVLGMVFDSQRLQVYPSCNLERIRKDAGDTIGEQALNFLGIFNDCESDEMFGTGVEKIAKVQRKRRRKAERVWFICHQAGQALLASESDPNIRSVEGRIASILGKRDLDLGPNAQWLLDSSSLEKEAFQSFQLLRTLVSAIDIKEKNRAVSMESVLAFAVSSIIMQSLRTMKSLKYQESVVTRDSSNEQEMRKLMTEELLRTYLEVFVALIAWIFRNSRDGVSTHWNKFELQLRDSFLSPILRSQSIDLAMTLQQLLKTSLAVIKGVGSAPSPNLRLGSISGFSSYTGDILHGIMRRSRQFLIASSKKADFLSLPSSLLQGAIVCIEGDEELALPRYLGSAFNACLEVKNASDVSPLGEGIDEYLSFVEEKTANTDVRLKKSSFFKDCILQRLHHCNTELAIQRRNLRVVRYLLDSEIDDPAIDANSLKALVKGMRRCLLKSLKEPVIDNHFLSEVLSCANRLASTPIVDDDSRQEPLLSWSRKSVEDGLPGDVAELTIEEQSGAYFWLFYKWLQNLGKIIVDTSEVGTERRSAFRKIASSEENNRDSFRDINMSEMMLETDLESSHRLLWQVEEVLFPSRDENNALLANIYRRREKVSQDSSSQQMEAWNPTANLRKCAKELMAEVVAQG